MAARELIVLGTASQVPTKARNHNALFLRWDDFGFLFDPGEGTQRQMAYAGLAASQITHIAITHFHGDHCLGLAALVQRISLDRVEHPIEVFYPQSGQVYYDRLRRASIFHDVAKLVPRPIGDPGNGLLAVGRVGDLTISVAALDHRVDCIGYRITEKDGRRMLPERLDQHGIRGPQIGELIRKGSLTLGERTIHLHEVSEERIGQKFALVMDTRPCNGARLLAKGTDMLCCEATYLDSERTEAHDHHHMTASQAATLALEGGTRRLVLTHFSQRYGSSGLFSKEAAAVFRGPQIGPDDLIAADDLTTVPLPSKL